MARAGYQCEHVDEDGRCPATIVLEVHHRDHDPSNNRQENLIVLCQHHHLAAHKPA